MRAPAIISFFAPLSFSPSFSPLAPSCQSPSSQMCLSPEGPTPQPFWSSLFLSLSSLPMPLGSQPYLPAFFLTPIWCSVHCPWLLLSFKLLVACDLLALKAFLEASLPLTWQRLVLRITAFAPSLALCPPSTYLMSPFPRYEALWSSSSTFIFFRLEP